MSNTLKAAEIVGHVGASKFLDDGYSPEEALREIGDFVSNVPAGDPRAELALHGAALAITERGKA